MSPGSSNSSGDEEAAWSRFRRRFPQFLDPRREQGDLAGELVPSVTWSIAAATHDRYLDPTTGEGGHAAYILHCALLDPVPPVVS